MTDYDMRILYYKTENDALFRIMMGKVDLEKLSETHVEVFRSKWILPVYLDRRDLLEQIFRLFNSDDSNPLSSEDCQKTIAENKLHTSMSVGDVVEITCDGITEIWVCKSVGWKRISPR